MTRGLEILFTLGLALLLAGCGGATCESLQEEIEDIGRAIQEDPSKALDEATGKELEALSNKLQELGCLG